MLFGGLLLAMLWVACGPVQGSAEVKGLRPGELGMLATARLDWRIKERIYAALLEEGGPGDREVAGKASVFVRVIGPGPRLGIEVGYPQEWCGATGNCGVMIFDGRTGRTLLGGEDGFDFGYLRTMHHGVRDFVIRANMSCCEGTRHVYRFDGREYQMYREVREVYDEELGAGKVRDAP
jgi:hypothetical protein